MKMVGDHVCLTSEAECGAKPEQDVDRVEVGYDQPSSCPNVGSQPGYRRDKILNVTQDEAAEHQIELSELRVKVLDGALSEINGQPPSVRLLLRVVEHLGRRV